MDGYPEIVKRFTVNKNKQGITGLTGNYIDYIFLN
jgi:hypothetical protein